MRKERERRKKETRIISSSPVFRIRYTRFFTRVYWTEKEKKQTNKKKTFHLVKINAAFFSVKYSSIDYSLSDTHAHIICKIHSFRSMMFAKRNLCSKNRQVQYAIWTKTPKWDILQQIIVYTCKRLYSVDALHS